MSNVYDLVSIYKQALPEVHLYNLKLFPFYQYGSDIDETLSLYEFYSKYFEVGINVEYSILQYLLKCISPLMPCDMRIIYYYMAILRNIIDKSDITCEIHPKKKNITSNYDIDKNDIKDKRKLVKNILSECKNHKTNLVNNYNAKSLLLIYINLKYLINAVFGLNVNDIEDFVKICQAHLKTCQKKYCRKQNRTSQHLVTVPEEEVIGGMKIKTPKKTSHVVRRKK
jgi:hypothetical protein